jgi:hypothetical protein
LRTKSAKDCHKFGRGSDIPNINSETEDERIRGENSFGDIERALIDIEFSNSGSVAEFP